PRGDRPLHEVPWPGRGRDTPRHLRAQSEAPSSGPFYELGSWMYSRLLLDGTTGRLVRDTTGGMAEPLAGSSLHQFFGMVRHFDVFTGILEAIYRYSNACWHPYPLEGDQEDVAQAFPDETDELPPGLFDPTTSSGTVWSWLCAGITELGVDGF